MAALDQLIAAKAPFLTDGGLETELVYHDHLNLPRDAAFVLLFEPRGRAALKTYFDRYLDLAETRGRGFVLDTATWRANLGWAASLGLNAADIRHANELAVKLAREIRDARGWKDRILINGCLGPRPADADLARSPPPDAGSPAKGANGPGPVETAYRPQLEALARGKVDLVTALSLTDVDEAIALTRLAQDLGLPIALCFALVHEGRLPGGVPIAEAVARIDAATGGGPLHYGISGTHPTKFLDQLRGAWLQRLGVVRPNATTLSRAEIHLAGAPDDNDPTEFGVLFAELARRLPRLRVIGGGAWADARHVAAAADWA